MSASDSAPWSSQYRLVAREKWKIQSAAMGGAVTEALVDYSSPVAGMAVLDLASGTGEPAITLAQRLSSTGSVIAIDRSSELLEITAGRARKKKLTNLVTRQADAHALPFPDLSFDLATCRFGVMFFANAQQALAELRRVLRPEARACFAVWGGPEQPYWQTTMKIVQHYVGGLMPLANDADPFRFAAPGSLTEALVAAGFQDIEEMNRHLPWTWPGDAKEVFEYCCTVAAPFRPMIERVPEEMWPAIRTEAIEAINRYRVGNEIRFGADIILASGRA